MIGRLYEVVVDCPDPRALAAFYPELTGLQVRYEDADWVTLGDDAGVRVAFQRVAEHRPPQWPDAAHPQQMQVEALGARLLQGGERSRVYADPAGHPFCLSLDDPAAP